MDDLKEALLMKRIRIFALLVAAGIMLTACAEGGSAGSSGTGETVEISGSTSVQPFIEVLAEEYERDFGGSPVDVQGGGSSTGILAARRGMANIGMSSRTLRAGETELDSGIILRAYTIALDGLALVVHPSNPVSDLTLEQIRAIYTREITDWSELDTTGQKSGAIHVVTREEGSGTRGAFEELVMQWREERIEIPDPCDNCHLCEEHSSVVIRENHVADIHARTIVLNTNGAIRQFVAGNPNAIGYISLGTVEIDGLDPVKGLNIDGVEPTPENVFNESYGLFRPFIFLISEDETDETNTFIDFVLSNEGQAKLAQHGLIRSPNATGLDFSGGTQ
jgi:phosphate transport system substrate-binding protein